MIYLGVNIDHIATIRQARGTTYPDPLDAVSICMAGGANSITAHLREDRRHIQDHDIERLAAIDGLHLNMEMGVTDEMVAICERLKPAACCLVPEKREELTTEGGLNLLKIEKNLNYISRTSRDIILGGDYDKNIAKLGDRVEKIRAHFTSLEKLMANDDSLSIVKEAKKTTMTFIENTLKMMKSLNPDYIKNNRVTVYNSYKDGLTPLANASRV